MNLIRDPAKGKAKVVEPEVEVEVVVEDCIESDEDVYKPSFGDVCPLHDEGEVEGDEDLDHFIFLASMCRDEQLFSTYFEYLMMGTGTATNMDGANGVADVDGTDDGNEASGAAYGDGRDDGNEASGAAYGNEAPAATEKQKRSRKKQSQSTRKVKEVRIADHGETLNDCPEVDLRNTELDDENNWRKKKLKHQSFRLTEACPEWNLGDVFCDRAYFNDVLRQYAVMTKRPVYLAKNDGKKLRAKCHGSQCDWFIYLRKFTQLNPNDYVLTTFQSE